MAQRALFGAFGSSSGTAPLPWPTNTPGPTVTDDLLPMMTLGWGDALDRVPSGQMMASPDSTPRRPSSQVTTGPSRWQVCASAVAASPTVTADRRIADTSVRLIVMPPSVPSLWRPINRRNSPVAGSRVLSPAPWRRRKSKIIKCFQSIAEIAGIAPAVTCQSPPAPSRE
jgi:hypothetical protein